MDQLNSRFMELTDQLSKADNSQVKLIEKDVEEIRKTMQGMAPYSKMFERYQAVISEIKETREMLEEAGED